MEPSKKELLAALAKECELYSSIPASEQQQKREKKCFIYGLMTASRIMGITFEELNSIIESMPQQPKFKDMDERLSIPTYVRNNVEIKL